MRECRCCQVVERRLFSIWRTHKDIAIKLDVRQKYIDIVRLNGYNKINWVNTQIVEVDTCKSFYKGGLVDISTELFYVNMRTKYRRLYDFKRNLREIGN